MGSMQELLRQRRLDGFVGRRAELALFQDNLATAPDDPAHRFLFHIHGNAGVGKSSLVRRLAHTARERRALTATLDESVNSVPEALETICAQFAGQGVRLKALERMLDTYRQRRYEAESAAAAAVDAAGGGGAPGAVPAPTTGSMVAAQAGLIGLGLVPGIGALAGAVDPARVAAGADGVRAALSRHLGRQEDVTLVLDPVRVLTPVLTAELERVASEAPWIVLFFDTYERTGPFLDPWLRDLTTTDRLGLLPAQTVITTSGQRPVDPHVWADCADLVTELPLAPFTESEARTLLAAKDVVDEEVVRDVLRLSGRLPVLVSTLAENAGRTGGVTDPSATAVERFLKWESDPLRRSAALDGALPRRLNEDIFRAAARTDETRELFGWLRTLPFVGDRGGRAQYHDVVRRPMLRLTRNSSPERWSAGHTRLADAFAAWAGEAGEGLPPAERWAQDGWRALRVEELYHRLCARPRTALPAVLRDGIDACDAGLVPARQWARTLADAGEDTGNDALGALARECRTALEDERRGGIDLLGIILGRDEPGIPDRAAALTVRARAHRLLGDADGALRDYRAAIALDEGNGRAHGGLGETQRLLGRYEEALAAFDRALEIDPADCWSLSSRAQAKHALGRGAEALADLDRSLEIRPRHIWALVRRAQVRRAAGDAEGALADIGRALETDPGNAWIVGEHGEILRRIGRSEEAVARYDRAIELDPGYAWAFGSRAMAKHGLGRTGEALADLGRALEIRPGYLWALVRRAEIHRETGDAAAELADLDRVVELARSREWALAQRGHAHQLAGRYEEALADYGAAIDHAPEYAYAHLGRARTHERLRRYEEALRDYDRADELAPGDGLTVGGRAQVLHALGRLGEALGELERAGELRPDAAWIAAEHGAVLQDLGRVSEAAPHFARALSLDPAYTWPHHRLPT
ncbi:tetratricopeptide repeat protein [Streptomyces sp. NPDC001985]|uniref:tetratricopeptide repeat protein n=1 Tax=Streptomyces sp. NPDC001985 TaxID=3154406 RepID=UPI003322A110